MRILVTGKNGQVGWELARSLLPLGEVISLERSEADFSRPEKLRPIIQSLKPDVIVNAAAYTAVDKAESEAELAMIINGIAPGVIAEEAKKIRALFIHYSTDYVFDGTKNGPYHEDDKPNPINVYGRSKLAGEEAIQESDSDYIILRTSWVYTARGHNFLNTMRKLVLERDELSIVADQTGTPTWARLIAETTAHCIFQSLLKIENGTFSSGLFHLTAKNETSWYEFTKVIVENICSNNDDNSQLAVIKPINTSDYPTPARRPLNSCLSTKKLEQYFGLVMPSWKSALQLCMDE